VDIIAADEILRGGQGPLAPLGVLREDAGYSPLGPPAPPVNPLRMPP
jgi:hypothetical protein